jgi:hypothetical protein
MRRLEELLWPQESEGVVSVVVREDEDDVAAFSGLSRRNDGRGGRQRAECRFQCGSSVHGFPNCLHRLVTSSTIAIPIARR